MLPRLTLQLTQRNNEDKIKLAVLKGLKSLLLNIQSFLLHHIPHKKALPMTSLLVHSSIDWVLSPIQLNNSSKLLSVFGIKTVFLLTSVLTSADFLQPKNTWSPLSIVSSHKTHLASFKMIPFLRRFSLVGSLSRRDFQEKNSHLCGN